MAGAVKIRHSNWLDRRISIAHAQRGYTHISDQDGVGHVTATRIAAHIRSILDDILQLWLRRLVVQRWPIVIVCLCVVAAHVAQIEISESAESAKTAESALIRGVAAIAAGRLIVKPAVVLIRQIRIVPIGLREIAVVSSTAAQTADIVAHVAATAANEILTRHIQIGTQRIGIIIGRISQITQAQCGQQRIQIVQVAHDIVERSQIICQILIGHWAEKAVRAQWGRHRIRRIRQTSIVIDTILILQRGQIVRNIAQRLSKRPKAHANAAQTFNLFLIVLQNAIQTDFHATIEKHLLVEHGNGLNSLDRMIEFDDGKAAAFPVFIQR